jgi:hypothetical protein
MVQVPVQYYKGPDEYLEALVTERKELQADLGKLENAEEENHEISADLAACRAQASGKDNGKPPMLGYYYYYYYYYYDYDYGRRRRKNRRSVRRGIYSSARYIQNRKSKSIQ